MSFCEKDVSFVGRIFEQVKNGVFLTDTVGVGGHFFLILTFSGKNGYFL